MFIFFADTFPLPFRTSAYFFIWIVSFSWVLSALVCLVDIARSWMIVEWIQVVSVAWVIWNSVCMCDWLQQSQRERRIAFNYSRDGTQMHVTCTWLNPSFPDTSQKLPVPPLGHSGFYTWRLVFGSYTEKYRQSYSTRTVKDWNILPQSVVSAGSLALFKSRLSSHAAP